MIRPTAQISIGDLSFDFLNRLEIESTWQSITDFGELTLPQRIRRGGEVLTIGSAGLFNRGDKVTIDLGYYPRSQRVFTGYVSAVVPDSPLILKLEDDAYLLKRNSITTSYESVSLRTLLTDLSPLPFETIDANLGSFRITRVNFAQVLEELNKVYGLESWVRSGVLYVGLAYIAEPREEHLLKMQKNIIEDSLEWQNSEDASVKIKAISIQPNNTKLEYETGDADGSTRTLHYYNLSESDLKAAAERDLPKYKFDGYRGSLTTFGEPYIKHGDAVRIEDIKFPEREGLYLVDSVVYSQGANEGFRQVVSLGARIT